MPRCCRRLLPLALLLVAAQLLSPALASARQPRQLSVEDYVRAERFLGARTQPLLTGLAGRVAWLDDGRFWYLTTTADGFDLMLVDPPQRTRDPLFDRARMAAALTAASGQVIAAAALPYPAMTLTSDGHVITFPLQGTRWRCDVSSYTCAAEDRERLPDGRFRPPPNSVVSPDGSRAAFTRGHNLWVRDLTTNQDRQLTTDGETDFGYATNNAGWARSDAPVLLWSPDSRKLATFQQDARGVTEMYVVAAPSGRPRLERWRYPMVGDSVIFRIHRIIIDVESGRVMRLQMPPDVQRSTIDDHVASGTTFHDVQWYPDASHLAFVSVSRDNRHVVLRVADAATGAVRDVFEESSATPIQSGFHTYGHSNWRLLAGSNEVLWWSQRDDWGHLYLYDLGTGRLKGQLTSGPWNVARVLRVDERDRVLLFTGVGREPGRDPYFEHLYRIDLNGRRLTLLTPENADHLISLSPDGRLFAHWHSTPTRPPVGGIRRITGELVMEFHHADISRLLATGWRPPTPIVVKARDSVTDLYGLMFTPTDLDPGRKYPVVNYVYSGPFWGSVGLRQFRTAHIDHQSLAELGFIVVAIDGHGTDLRSRRFLDLAVGDLGDAGIPDQIAGIRQLAERHQFIDLDRVGVWGHSSGGFAAASAILRHPDFYKVAISQAGVHDHRSYEDNWGERWHGLLQRTERGDNHESQANHLLAANLRGKLLLAHGALDNNVAVYQTYLLVDALIKANKDFDLIIFPQQRHGFGADEPYMMRRRWDYFVRHLLGAEPPPEYRIGGR
jgi:dipeptidyl-peptidase 4